MRNVLFVDDEGFIRTSIISMIDWGQYGYHPPLEAENGKEALWIINSDRIDLVFLDMSMPVMDGIGFLQSLAGVATEERPAVVVLSAYNEFSLVRDAFNYGVLDYTLKSEISGTMILDILGKAESHYRKFRRSTGSPPADDGINSEIQRLALNELISVPINDKCRELLARYTPDLKPELCLFAIWPDLSESRFDSLENRNHFNTMLLGTFRNVISRYGIGMVFVSLSSEICILLNTDTDAGSGGLISIMRELQEASEKYLNTMVSVEMCGPVYGFESIHDKWEMLRSRKKQGSRMVIRAKRYVAIHYAEPRITLDDLATYCSVSKNHLSANFTRETGMTISEYIAHIRVQKAAELLSSTNMLVYEVAEKVGYLNVEHFSRQFKRIMSCSPGKYVGAG